MILKRQFFLKYQTTPTIYQVMTVIEAKEFQFLKCKYVFKTPKQVTDVAMSFYSLCFDLQSIQRYKESPHNMFQLLEGKLL